MYLPARGGEAGEIGAAVAAAGLGDDARAGGGGQRGRVVLGGVVDDEHLAVDRAVLQRAERGGHADLDVLGLVQAGDHDRHQRRGAVGIRGDRGLCLDDCAHGRLLGAPVSRVGRGAMRL